MLKRANELIHELLKKNRDAICNSSSWETSMNCNSSITDLRFYGKLSGDYCTVNVCASVCVNTLPSGATQYVCTMSPWKFTLKKLKNFEITKKASLVEPDTDPELFMRKIVALVVLMGCDYMHGYLCQRSAAGENPLGYTFRYHVGFDDKVVKNHFRSDSTAVDGSAAVEGFNQEIKELKRELKRSRTDLERAYEHSSNLSKRLDDANGKNRELQAQLQSSNHTSQSAGDLLTEFARLRNESAEKDKEIAQLREDQKGCRMILAENINMKRILGGGKWPFAFP